MCLPAGIQGWLEGTLDYFAETPELQLIIRVHPGELLNPEGYSVGDSVKAYFPDGDSGKYSFD